MSRFAASSGPWEHKPRKAAQRRTSSLMARVLVLLCVLALLITLNKAIAHHAALYCAPC